MRITAARSIRGSFAWRDAGLVRASQLDHILLVVAWVLDQVADRTCVARWLRLKGLYDVEFLGADLRNAHVQHAVVRSRIDAHLAARRVNADSRFQCLDDLGPFQRSRFLDTLRP